MTPRVSTIILLTATFDPNGMVKTDLSDIHQRIKAYKDALYFYNQFNTPIVFAENSCTDGKLMAELREIFPTVDFHFFNGNDFDKTLGKGYGESKIIEYAIKHSKYINDNTVLIKITGRIITTNIENIIKYYTNHDKVDIAVNTSSKGFPNSRLFIFKSFFFKKYFLPYQPLLNDSKNIYFEHALQKALIEGKVNGKNVQYIRYLPQFRGISGSTSEDLEINGFNLYVLRFKHLIKYHLIKFTHEKYWLNNIKCKI